MNSVVIELQQNALDNNISISDLLRKAMVVAKKLNIIEFEAWINNELNGYSDYADIPEYRTVIGDIKALNPFHGWQPVLFIDTNWAEKLSKCPFGHSIAEIEGLLANQNSTTFLISFPKELEKTLMDNINLRSQVSLVIHRTRLIKILDTVRTIILNWSLKLEENGILGENLTFTKEEKQSIPKQSYNINNFYGTVNSPQIQQQSSYSNQISNNFNNDLETIKSFLKVLQENKPKLSLSNEDSNELDSEIETIDAQVKSPKPKINIIQESLTSIRTIIDGASGSVAAHLIIELAKLFGS